MTTMPADDAIKIGIGQDGVQYRERGTLGWMSKEFDWEEIKGIEILDVGSVNGHQADGDIALKGTVVIEKESNEAGDEEEHKDVFENIHSETGIAVNPDAGRVSFDPQESDAENFRMFFRYLVENGHIKRSDLPFKTDKQDNYILNTEPEHPSGEMRRGQEIAEGVWLETSIPVNQKQHHILEASRTFLL